MDRYRIPALKHWKRSLDYPSHRKHFRWAINRGDDQSSSNDRRCQCERNERKYRFEKWSFNYIPSRRFCSGWLIINAVPASEPSSISLRLFHIARKANLSLGKPQHDRHFTDGTFSLWKWVSFADGTRAILRTFISTVSRWALWNFCPLFLPVPDFPLLSTKTLDNFSTLQFIPSAVKKINFTQRFFRRFERNIDHHRINVQSLTTILSSFLPKTRAYSKRIIKKRCCGAKDLLQL